MFAVFCPIRDEACSCKKRNARLATTATLEDGLEAQVHHLVYSSHHYMKEEAARSLVDTSGTAWIEAVADTAASNRVRDLVDIDAPTTRTRSRSPRRPAPSTPTPASSHVTVSKDTIASIMMMMTRAEATCRCAARLSASAARISAQCVNEAENIRDAKSQLENLLSRS